MSATTAPGPDRATRGRKTGEGEPGLPASQLETVRLKTLDAPLVVVMVGMPPATLVREEAPHPLGLIGRKNRPNEPIKIKYDGGVLRRVAQVQGRPVT